MMGGGGANRGIDIVNFENGVPACVAVHVRALRGGISLLLTRVVGPAGELLRKLACCARGVGTLRLVFIAVCMSAEVCRGGMGRPTRSTEAGPGASISCVIFFVCCVPSSTHQRAPAGCLNTEREDGWLCSSMCSGRSQTRIGSAAGMNSLTPCRDWTAAAHGIPGVAKPAKVRYRHQPYGLHRHESRLL